MLLRWKKRAEDDTQVEYFQGRGGGADIDHRPSGAVSSVLLQLSLRSFGDIPSFESDLNISCESWCATLRLSSLWQNVKAFCTAAHVRECKGFFPSLVLLHCIRCVTFLKGNTPIKSQCVAALCSGIYLHRHPSVLLQTSCPVQTAAFHLQA